jgi:hypothetical protein
MAHEAAAVNPGLDPSGRSPDVALNRSFLRRRRKAIILVVSVLVGIAVALSTLYTISVLPPGLHSRSVTIGVAATHLVIDAPQGLVPATGATSLEYSTYTDEATMLANVLATDPVRTMVARAMRVNADVVTARARITGVDIGAYTDQVAEQRANEILVQNRPYKLETQADPNLPEIAIYGQAPSASAAARIVDAAVTALQHYISANPSVTGLGRRQQPMIKQLGVTRGAVVNTQEALAMVLIAFLVGFGVALSVLVGFLRMRRAFIAAGRTKESSDSAAGGRPARRVSGDSTVAAGGDWPRTTRVMPWMIAGFLIVIWLVPFNAIQLPVSLPFDLKFDRIVLPLLVVGWLLSMAAGGPAAPRLRLTRIHLGFLTFVAVVALGIVLNTTSLNQALEVNFASKKLTLLLSYGLMFAIIASSVRRTELPAFFKFSMGLAVIVALGSIWEYRFHYNVFYDLSSRILDKIFVVTPYDPNAVDDLGRRMVQGPTDHPLELVGALVMMFSFALIGVLRSERRRNRVLYGLAACLLMGAMVSSDRKSALLAPLAVFLVVCYHYRRKLLRLAPLLLALVIAVHALSPGALGTVVDQLNPSRLGVGTVSDRTSDYDAVRPDLWTHLAFGRGYGTYDHVNYRTLDSDILNRLIDTGILGTCAFVFMLLCIVTVSRRLIRSRDPAIEPIALAVVASTVAYFVLCFLFDVSSFPHVPYILFSLAGLVAAGESGVEGVTASAGRAVRDVHRRSAAGGDAGKRAIPALSGREFSYSTPSESRRSAPTAPTSRRRSHRSRSD